MLLEEITGEAQDSDRPFDVLTLYLGVGLIGVTVFHDDGVRGGVWSDAGLWWLMTLGWHASFQGLLVSHGAIPYEKIMEWHGSEKEFMMRIPSETLVGNEEVVFLVPEVQSPLPIILVVLVAQTMVSCCRRRSVPGVRYGDGDEGERKVQRTGHAGRRCGSGHGRQ